jgi:Flp pilus assembly protein TadB
MAQTKKKRQTKHRGNAAGQIQARGRTGRKPTDSERKGGAKDDARARRQARLDQPPTWRGALNRAFIATGLFLVLLLLFFRSQQIGPKLGIAAFMLLLYVPLGYYTDLFIYRRRQARKLRDQAARRQSDGT